MSEQATPNLPAEAQERIVREDFGWIELSDQVLIEVTGEDRQDWLQGQVTNDLRILTPDRPIDACLCTPTGQLLAILRLWDYDGRIFIATHRDAAEAVLARVEQMVIMEDVEAKRLNQQIVTIQGPNASSVAQDVGLLLPSDRLGFGGFDVAAETTSSIDLSDDHRFDHDLWRALQLANGVPIFGIDTNPKTLPPELGPAFIATHISYNKGCYTGQEVIARIESRGHTNQTWRALLCNRPLQTGETLSHPDKEQAGVVTSAGWLPSLGYFAGAMVRNEVKVGDQVSMSDGTTAFVKDFPIF